MTAGDALTSTAWRRVRVLDPTDVANALATSFAGTLEEIARVSRHRIKTGVNNREGMQARAGDTAKSTRCLLTGFICRIMQ